MRYFEDFAIGDVHDLGEVSFTADEIVEFGRRWDPQPFHVDAEAAKESSFGGLVASGIHTLAALMRLFVDGVLADTASQGSPGVEQLRWRKPVRPGDVLRGRITVEDARPSGSRPDRGTLTLHWELVDLDGGQVLSMRSRNLVGRRPS